MPNSLEAYEHKQRGDLSKNKSRAYIKLKYPLAEEIKELVIDEISEILKVSEKDISIQENLIVIEPLVGKLKKTHIQKAKKQLNDLLQRINELNQEESNL